MLLQGWMLLTILLYVSSTNLSAEIHKFYLLPISTMLNVLLCMILSLMYLSGAEQEWKLAQSSMEAATNSLFSAANELSIASATAKSASGKKISFFNDKRYILNVH